MAKAIDRLFVLSMFFMVLALLSLVAWWLFPPLTMAPLIVSFGTGVSFGLAMIVCVLIEIW